MLQGAQSWLGGVCFVLGVTRYHNSSFPGSSATNSFLGCSPTEQSLGQGLGCLCCSLVVSSQRLAACCVHTDGPIGRRDRSWWFNNCLSRVCCLEIADTNPIFTYIHGENSTRRVSIPIHLFIILEIRESQDLAKDFGETTRSWKGNKAMGMKIYNFKKLLSYIKKQKKKRKEEKKNIPSARNRAWEFLRASPFRYHYATTEKSLMISVY